MRIKDFARKTGFSEDTLRYYEKIGLMGRVLRDTSGHRIYREDDLRWAEFLGRLKATGMPIAGMRRYAKAHAAGDGTAPERHAQLVEHRAKVAARIAELSANLSILDTKIAAYLAMISNEEGSPDDTGNPSGARPSAAE